MLSLLLQLALLDGAEPPPPLPSKHALAYDDLLVAGYNPARLGNQFRLGYRYRLYDRPGKIRDGSYLGTYLHLEATPARLLLGPSVDLKPAAFVRLRGAYLLHGFLGAFRHLQSYPSSDADWSKQSLDQGRDAGEHYATTGGRFVGSLRLQVLAWRILIRNEATMTFNHVRLHDGDRTFFSITLDALVPNHGWAFSDDLDLAYLHDFPNGRRLVVGGRATFVRSLWTRQLREDAPREPLVRAGPVVAFRFFDDPERRWNQPTAFIIAQWHALHPWRTGPVQVQDEMGNTVVRGVSQALPTFLAGLTFQGELVGREGR